MNIWLAALVGLVVAGVLGLVNGLLIGVLNLPSLAITLGTLAAYRGLAYVILGGSALSGFPTGFTNIGGGYISNELPYAVLVLRRLRRRARLPPPRHALRPVPVCNRIEPRGNALLGSPRHTARA